MLPHPDYYGYICFTREEAEIKMAADKRFPPDELICYYDEGNRWYRVTTKKNFECAEYWNGQPPEADDLRSILEA
jgi:hypothetical protein